MILNNKKDGGLIMRKYLFQANKNMYKANLHCHSTVSDGKYTPSELKDVYMAEGYSIIAYTDHYNSALFKNGFQCHNDLSDSNFLAINGCEIGVAQKNPDNLPFSEIKLYHINLYATNPSIAKAPPFMTMDYHDVDAINKYIQQRNEEGFIACYNHPYWSVQDRRDYCDLKGFFAMEIYNHNCEVENSFGYSPRIYDEMLRTGRNIYCLASDDNHNVYYHDSFGGFTMINCENLEYETVINALKNGDFYASQGPQIYEISLEDNKLRVKCSDAILVVVYTNGRAGYIKHGVDLNEVEFELSGQDKYIRVMCRDKNYKEANSNAFWL